MSLAPPFPKTPEFPKKEVAPDAAAVNAPLEATCTSKLPYRERVASAATTASAAVFVKKDVPA